MYTKHFGLTSLPFENVTDPTFYFDAGDYSRIRDLIVGSFNADGGLAVIMGPVGAGKTTLSQMIRSDLSDNVKTIWMAAPPEHSVSLLRYVAQELGLKTANNDRIQLLNHIRNALTAYNDNGRRCLIIIDESQLASQDTFNGIASLNNLRAGTVQLTRMLLLGQEELAARLNGPDMEPFRRRLSVFEALGRLSADGIQRYIAHRIDTAGGVPSIFSEEGWNGLIIASGTGGGVPRVINALCHKSLVIAYEKNKPSVDIDDVYEAARDIGISSEIFQYRSTLRNNSSHYQLQSKLIEDSVTYSELHGGAFVNSFSSVPSRHKNDHGIRTDRSLPIRGLRESGLQISATNIVSYCRSFLGRILHSDHTGRPEPDNASFPMTIKSGSTMNKTDFRNINNDAPPDVTLPLPSSEWVTVGPGGAKDFTPDNFRAGALSGNKGNNTKRDEWITVGTGRAKDFTPRPYASKKAETRDGRVEWITMNSGRTGSAAIRPDVLIKSARLQIKSHKR